MAKTHQETIQKVAKHIKKLVQKVAKTLTTFYIYDNNIINGGNNDEEIIWKKIIRLERIRNEKAINGNSEYDKLEKHIQLINLEKKILKNIYILI